MASPPMTDFSPTVVQPKSPTSSRTPLRKETLHSVEVWESKRDMIKELYLDQNRPLREVAKFLETQHDFIASAKQYKIRFKQWGFWKNLSKQHASSLLELKNSRESLGKSSTFVRSGKKLEQNRIERTIRRSKARALARQETEQDTSEMPMTMLSVPSVMGQWLPTGIECRTPSPEPQLNHSDDSSFDSSYSFEPELYACQSLKAYNLDEAANHQEQQITYQDKLKTYEIATRKLKTVQFPCGITAPSEQPAGVQAFRHRNALLAVLEPAVIDKNKLCTKYLQNYAAMSLDFPKLSLFSRKYVLSALSPEERSVNIAALATEVENYIKMGIDLLQLSAQTINLIERAASPHRSNMLGGAVFTRRCEDVVNPAELDGLFGTDLSSFHFGAFDFRISDELWVVSTSSSPTTTTVSASDHAMSPSTLFDSSTPATEAEPMALNVDPTAFRREPDHLELHLLHQLDLSVSLYQSGSSTSAVAGLRSVAFSENLSSVRGKVLTRLAWFCLSCIYREEGRCEHVGYCLEEAVRSSTSFRDDRGEDWHEVRHLFL